MAPNTIIWERAGKATHYKSNTIYTPYLFAPVHYTSWTFAEKKKSQAGSQYNYLCPTVI